MAVALVLDFPGGTREQYDQVMQRMHLDGQMPSGGLAHVAGSYGGGWRVIDVWEDMGAFARFRDEQIVPHTQAVGLPEPQVRMVEVDELHEGGSQSPKLVQVVRIAGMDADTFHSMDNRILPGGDRPEHVVWHVHGPADGDWCVIDTWSSREERDRFIQERVMPAMQEAGVGGPPQIEEMDVVASMGAGARATA